MLRSAKDRFPALRYDGYVLNLNQMSPVANYLFVKPVEVCFAVTNYNDNATVCPRMN